MTKYVELHSHTQYSRLDGLNSPKVMASVAASLGYPALGILDHGSMSGIFQHYRSCNEYGIKPIIGSEMYLSPSSRTDRASVVWGSFQEGEKLRTGPGNYTHLSVIAKDSCGLRSMFALQRASYLEGHYNKPRIDKALLEQNKDGLLILSGCIGGEVATYLRMGLIDKATESAQWFKDVFGEDYYIELMNHNLSFDDEINRQLIDLSNRLHISTVATNDCHYGVSNDAYVHSGLLCVQTGSKLSNPERFKLDTPEFYLKSSVDMLRQFTESPRSVAETLRIAEKIGSYEDIFTYHDLMPTLPGDSPSLRVWADRGLLRRRPDWETRGVPEEYVLRLDYESRTIQDLGYSGYFGVLGDLVAYAKSQDILVGPGRGSAGGSLVAYAMGITDLDPIHHGLVFERFLNPERKSAPDIDIDFQRSRRHEVVEYAIDKYGDTCVAKIQTFSTMGSRRAVLDAGKILGRDVFEARELANLVPELVRGRQEPLSECPQIKAKDPELYTMALGLEGGLRDESKHAAGIIISPIPLHERIPVKKGPGDDILVTGFQESELSALGFNKQDLLGLSNLDTIQETMRLINEVE